MSRGVSFSGPLDPTLMPDTPAGADWQAHLDRRIEERREEDRQRHRTIIGLVGVLVTVVSILVSLGVAWGTSTANMAQKVDKVEQLKVDAGLDARITVNSQKIDGITQSLERIQAGMDSANVRLRQIACDGKPASCR